MTTPAFAPYVPTYANYTPYISGPDFLNEATGVDTSQLIPAGSTATESAVLARLVMQASGEADRICKKVLAATLDVVSDEFRIFRDRTIRVPVPYSPLVSVNAVSLGYAATGMTPLTSLTGIRITRNVARIPVASMPASLSFSSTPQAYAQNGWIFADVTYVSGWAHTTMAAASLAAGQISPVNVLGIVPGMPLTIYDGTSTEVVTVASSYVPGAATVPLASVLQFAHAGGVTVSALPPAIRRAVVNLAKSMIKSKGSKAVVMPAINGRTVSRAAPKEQKTGPGGDEDYQAAKETLLSFKRSR